MFEENSVKNRQNAPESRHLSIKLDPNRFALIGAGEIGMAIWLRKTETQRIVIVYIPKHTEL